jgi:ADP-ribose pyrophosphatase YjhB (NUDIX family)
MRTYTTVVGIVKFGNKLLLLKRNHNRSSSPDKWQFVSGFIKERESAEDAVLREVKEETDLDGKIMNSGKVFEVTDNWGRWIILPFLISVTSDKVSIDLNEHSEYKWILPKEVVNFDCVAAIKEDMNNVGISTR